MVRLASSISQLNSKKILVVGDLMLDTYTIGKVNRISPEAPVAVVQVLKEDKLPGGAGNVVLNLVSLGAEVSLIGRIGPDSAGAMLKEILQLENVDVSGLFTQNDFQTPVKNRVIADNQQLVRVDYEKITALSEMLEQQIIDALPRILSGVAAIAISDYGKGFLTRTLLSAIIDQAKILDLPIITDPKGIDFSKYSGSTIIKPNLSEAYAAAGVLSDSSLDLVATKILEQANAEMLMITRSKDGISVFIRNGERLDFPVRVCEIKDVTGAGDTVLAVLTYALANKLSINEATQLSNVAAGLAIERLGCARVTLSDLARRLLTFDVNNKVFDEEHIFALQEALRNREFHLLGLSSNEGMTSTIFGTIQQLATTPNNDLVVYLTDEDPNENFVNLLASMQNVKFIIIQGNSLSNLCDKVKPVSTSVVIGEGFIELQSFAELLN